MFGSTEIAILLTALLVMVFAGVHIAVALGMASVLGIYLMQGNMAVVYSFIGTTAYESLRDYVFAVIPLFMLMGEFLAKCGAARDLFALTNRLTKKSPAGWASPPCSPTPYSPSSPASLSRQRRPSRALPIRK